MKEIYFKTQPSESKYFTEYIKVLPDKFFVIIEYKNCDEDDKFLYYDVVTHLGKYVPGEYTNEYTVKINKQTFINKLKCFYNSIKIKKIL